MLDGAEWRNLLLSVGTHQGSRPLSPIEVAEFIQRLVRAGETKATIASKLHLNDASMVAKFLTLLNLAEDVRPLVDWGSKQKLLSMSSALEIARLPENEQIALSAAVLKHQLNKSETQQVVQLKLRTGRQVGACVDQTLAMRPTITVREVLVGAIQDESVQHALLQLVQTDRDELLRRSLLGLGISGAAVRLQPKRFVISGSQQVGDQVRSLQPDFEQAVCQAIQQNLCNGYAPS
ncbi:ParB/RepB/Spo0J family partition protein [Ramlibacter rhizophilus]|uniref:ParB/Spo0J HTH domain-containing protein n=1 Tax=Ramlibacter rhizophilus TaxID=1781167 RepID=A0A4Z0BXZ9_9BURK|nr:hypothetical protein [Ramlibacter rhizophilus]TFZ03394.1 hypothetical protein EZ242_05795 [Ramlibacter rhizophilus]